MKGELSIRDKYSPAYTFSYTCTISKGYGNRSNLRKKKTSCHACNHTSLVKGYCDLNMKNVFDVAFCFPGV